MNSIQARNEQAYVDLMGLLERAGLDQGTALILFFRAYEYEETSRDQIVREIEEERDFIWPEHIL